MIQIRCATNYCDQFSTSITTKDDFFLEINLFNDIVLQKRLKFFINLSSLGASPLSKIGTHLDNLYFRDHKTRIS